MASSLGSPSNGWYASDAVIDNAGRSVAKASGEGSPQRVSIVVRVRAKIA
jgi:hypothetical protein